MISEKGGSSCILSWREENLSPGILDKEIINPSSMFPLGHSISKNSEPTEKFQIQFLKEKRSKIIPKLTHA